MTRKSHWFWGAVLKRKSDYLQIILASVFINVFALASSFYIMTVYDRVIPNDALETLIALTIGVSAVIIFDLIMKTLRGLFIDRAGKYIDLVFGKDLFERLSRDYSVTNKNQIGTIAATIKEFDTLKDFISSATFVTFADIPFTFLFLFVLWTLGGAIAAVPAIIIVILLIFSFIVFPFLKRSSSSGLKETQNKQGVLVELFSGMETIKTLPGIFLLENRWMKSVENQADLSGFSKAISQFASNMSQTGQQVSQVGIVVYGVVLIGVGELSMGSLIACVILSGRCLAPISQITSLLSKSTNAFSAYKALNEILKDKNFQNLQYTQRKDIQPNIQLNNVSFNYENSTKPTINNLNLRIETRDKIALLGPIGSGKTTLLRLLAGLITPSNGSILIDGIESQQIDPVQLRDTIGFVSQTPILFTGSIKENLLLGNPEAKDEDIVKACTLSGIINFINKLEKGFETILFERGAQLSGGQRQSLSLARTLIGNPKIVLMDEPTSAFDSAGEMSFLKNMPNFLDDKTLILVTHKSSLLSLVDKILIIEDGLVKGYGPKEKMIRKNV